MAPPTPREYDVGAKAGDACVSWAGPLVGLTAFVYTIPCVHMRNASKGMTTDVTMREFRAAPAKILRRAARAGAKLRVGEFVLAVEEVASETATTSLYGCMAGTGHLIGDPDGLLSADDRWSTDG